MRRREVITLLGGAAAVWPLAARAQQPAMPVIGFIHAGSPTSSGSHIASFRQGLNEMGYVEGRNITIEYRWAEGRPDRYPELAADLIRRKVNVIATGANTPASRAAKAATSTIPIVFGVGDDPVKLGLVANLAQPGGNATGINFFIAEWLEAARTAARNSARGGACGCSRQPGQRDHRRVHGEDERRAAPALRMHIQIFHAGTIHEIDATFASHVRQRFDAVFVGPDPFFNTRRVQLAIATARHAIPTIFAQRDYAEAGGLMSHGANVADAYRQVGVYTGRILKGEKPADLPVVQSTKFELVINAQTARTLGLTIPPSLLAIADEVIE